VTLKLDLLTANLWGLPWPVARARRDRKRRFIEHLTKTDYDVVGIQELWWPWWKPRDLASVIRPRTRRDSGLALAARLPVRDEIRVDHFADHAGFDRLKRKGALRASVETPLGTALSVCVAHLQAGRRHAQVRQLGQLLAGLARDRRPTLLMGDFNLHGDVEEDRRSAERLRSAGFVDAALALSQGEATYVSSNPYVRRRVADERFDRVYLRDASDVRLQPLEADVVRVHPRPLSDHHPLRVRIRLSE
jgi:endonuclease/exonuclease/phosphatase family metal-dependent hydrolase